MPTVSGTRTSGMCPPRVTDVYSSREEGSWRKMLVRSAPVTSDDISTRARSWSSSAVRAARRLMNSSSSAGSGPAALRAPRGRGAFFAELLRRMRVLQLFAQGDDVLLQQPDLLSVPRL